MATKDFLKRFLVVGERNILSRLTNYVDLAQHSLSYLKQMFILENADYEGLNEKIRLIEKEGDDYTLTMNHDITSGAISSNLMDTLINLVGKCDDLLDDSYFMSREIRRMMRNHSKNDQPSTDLMRHSYSKIAEMLSHGEMALSLVKELFNSADISIIKTKRKEIEGLEEEVDELKDDLIDEVYRDADNISFLMFNHIISLIHKMDDFLDYCEDISDDVLNIVMAVTK
jgi:uncharacterized protein Yka (UPF0111/DUF47 family)